MGTIKVKARCLKCTYRNGDFTIFSWSLIEPNENIKLSTYSSFSSKGENGYISEGKDYELEVEVLSVHPTYGSTVFIKSVPSLDQLDFKNLTKEESFEILMECTSSERIANNILKAYPNFIELVLTEGKEAIDISRVKGMGDVYLNAYTRDLTNKYKYYHILKAFKDYQLDITDCKTLCAMYKDEIGIKSALNTRPYEVLCDTLNRRFDQADKMILELQPKFKETSHRCEYLVLSVLKRNEEDGSTRLNGNDLYYYIQDEINKPELLPLVVDTVKNSEKIYYDELSKDCAIMNTYIGEVYVADFIKNKIKNSTELNIDWRKYTKVNDFTMSEKQSEALEMFCKYNFSVLAGYSGCVDCDTEFFNGKQWKKISEYLPQDLVLQYNKDGSANLVKPQDYIKLPSDYLYHFETKYGLSQTLSEEHRIIYYTQNNIFKENTLAEVMEINNKYTKGFVGKIPTSFKYSGNGIDLTDNEIKIMCAVICDGSFYSHVNENCDSYNRCRFHIKKNRKKEELRRLFKESNIWWREKESATEGYTDFYINAPRREKEFTDYWYNCNNHQLQLICDNIMQWDGSNTITLTGKDRFKFSTTIKKTADFIQFAYSSCGYRASISINDRIGRPKKNKKNGKTYYDKSIEYSVGITHVTKCSIMNDHKKADFIKVPTKDGYKYCFTVDSGMLVLRNNNKIFCTGNSGKSTSLQGLIYLMEDNHMSYTLLAPTGSASKRIAEVTRRDASTIHKRVLKYGDIESDVVLVDESSMVDLPTFIMLLQAIKNGNCRIVLIGDPKQLASVGIGTIFADIINSNEIPMITLTEIFRYNSNGSLFIATNTRNGKSFIDSDDKLLKWSDNKMTLNVGDNYKFIQTDDILDTLMTEYLKFISKGFKPKDILVLSPMNVRSCGTYEINNTIQAEINPFKPNEQILSRTINGTEIKFKLGDLVLNTKNDYKAIPLDSWKLMENDPDGLLTEDDIPLTEVMNGQKGKIIEIDNKKLVIQFDEELIVFPKIKLNHLLLGFAVSIHRMQGSESNVVLNIISPEHSKMLSRNLLYVALTRSKKYHVDIGNMSAFEDALKIEEVSQRDTFLPQLLIEQKEKEN